MTRKRVKVPLVVRSSTPIARSAPSSSASNIENDSKPAATSYTANTNNKKRKRADFIADFHTLIKEKEKVQSNDKMSEKEKKQKVKEIDAKIEEMGGLDTYQQASIQGEHQYERECVAKQCGSSMIALCARIQQSFRSL